MVLSTAFRIHPQAAAALRRLVERRPGCHNIGVPDRGKHLEPSPATRAGAASVTILTGPARCGKTTAVLELYRRRMDELGRAGCLLIVPNVPAAAHMRQRLLELSETGVLIAPAVTTFAGLAAGILSAAGRPARILNTVHRRLLLWSIVNRPTAAGGLRALGPLSDAPGLVTALDAAIAELKRAAVEPEALAKAIDPSSGKDADLLSVYRRYQDQLRKAERFDVEGLMWLARDVLARDEGAPLGYPAIAAVGVDGFTDFTPTQLEILSLLARRVDSMLITLPFAAQPRRRRMWFWTERTLQRIRRAIPGSEVTAAEPGGDPFESLFDLPGGKKGRARASEPASAAAATGGPAISVTVLAAADVEAEVRAVARAVKADLAGGAEPGSVAVMARDLSGYEEPIRRIFAAHDVPVASRPTRLDACGVVRFILRLLSLPPAYAFHDVLAVIRNSYFRPGALGAGLDAATVATAEMAIRTANVLGGRTEYSRAFRRLADRARSGGEEFAEDEETVALGPLSADAEAIERAGAMLAALMARLDRLAAPEDVGAYVRAVRELIGELQLPAAVVERLRISDESPAVGVEDDASVAADLRALRAFDELLEDLTEAPLSPAGRSRAEELTELVSRLAEAAVCPPARAESLAEVLDVLDGRSLRFRRVYLLGVNERAFPRLAQETCFIAESDRLAWAARGVALDSRSDLIAREMLLFYLAATRADEALTVSFLTAEASGRPHAASSFLEELASTGERQGAPCRRERIGPGEFVPPPDELSSPADAFNAAVFAAFSDEAEAKYRPAALLGWARRHRPEWLRRASFGIFAADRRWRAGEVDAFDGRLDDPKLLAGLGERIPAKWTFSASQLNSYARCPWQFFARHLLHLEPLVEPEARMTPAAMGSFCHAVLWRVMTSLRERAGGPVKLAETDEGELRALLAEAVEAERRRLADRAMYSALWDVQTGFWREMLWAYLADQRQAVLPTEAVCFELGFGLTQRRAGRMDPASRPEPVELDAGGERIRLEGKIDRVDQVAPDAALLAVDYKSGRLPAGKDILSGRDLQLALYAEALEAIFDRACAGGAYHGVRENAQRYFASVGVSRGRIKEDAEYPEKLAFAMNAVGRCVQGMRAGRFDALPGGDCPKWCPYRQICHYAKHRARSKTGGSGPGESDSEAGHE